MASDDHTNSASELKKTSLHDWHLSQQANMAEFGGYDMPLWYRSARAEHLAVITSAGIFDTSHMAVVAVMGPAAHDLLQYAVTKDLNACIGPKSLPLSTGRCVYGAFLTEDGGVLDDTIIYRTADQEYLAVVNAGMGAAVTAHLGDLAEKRMPEALRDGKSKDERGLRITDLTGTIGKMDIQGPLSARIMEQLLADPDAALDKLPYFGFRGGIGISLHTTETEVRTKRGIALLISRTGYTGEFGFELFLPARDIQALWDAVLAVAEPMGGLACGLAARDSLRAGAVLPLSHQDIGPWPFVRHPWPFALPLNEAGDGFTKEFHGAAALKAALADEENAVYTYPFAGNDVRKATLPATVKDEHGVELGRVLTCATDVSIGRHGKRIMRIATPELPKGLKTKGLSCGFLTSNRPLSPGEGVILDDGRRNIMVFIESDIRPYRSARTAMSIMRKFPDEERT